MLISPLEQFELKIIYGLHFLNYIDVSISNSVFFMLFGTLIILLILCFGTFKARILPGPIQRLCELFYIATLRVANEVVGQRGIKYFPIFFSIFLIILGSNIIGLLPQAFAPFSHIITSL
jgi:F-type H+-transporting ATPase subunit a